MSTARSASWKSSRNALAFLAIAACALFALCPSAVMAQQDGVEIVVVSPSIVATAPGNIVSMSFRVTNRSAGEQEFIETITLPRDWQQVIPASRFTLKAGESTPRITAIQALISVPAGRYQIQYSVRGQEDYVLQYSVSVTIVVLPVVKIALLLEEHPDAVIAGEQCSASVRVINQSNTPLEATLGVESRLPRNSITVTPSRVSLAAGDSQLVNINIRTSTGEKRQYTENLVLTAQADGSAQGMARASLPIGIEIVPRAASGNNLDHVIPTELITRLTGNKDNYGVQTTWKGCGPLEEGGDAFIDFLLQAPDIQASSTFGLHEEYRLRYSSPGLDIKVGDNNFGLSYLTRCSRYGRGVAIDAQKGAAGMGMGMSYITDRWNPGQQIATAYLIPYKTDKMSAKVNMLSFKGDNADGSQRVHDMLWSLELAGQPSPYMNVSAEYARCNTTRATAGNGDAYTVEVSGYAPKLLSYSYRKTHAGVSYFGDFHDSDYSTGSLLIPMNRRFSVSASYSTYARNLASNPDLGMAPQEQLWRMGARYDLLDGWYASVSYDRFQHIDRLGPDTLENAIDLSVGHSDERISWTADYRQGVEDDNLHNRLNNVRDLRLFASYRPAPKYFISMHGGQRSDGVDSELLGSKSYYGGSINWSPNKMMSMSGWFTKYDYSDGRASNTQAEFRANYTFQNQTSMALRLLRKSDQPEVGTSYELTYSVPFDLAVGTRKRVGMVHGRIFDATSVGKPGISGVVLTMNGAAAVTDASGDFSFPALPPGEYTMSVDRRSIGLQRIPEQGLPIKVTIVGGKDLPINIGVIPVANLTGSVMVMPAAPEDGLHEITNAKNTPEIIGDPNSPDALTAPKGLGNVLIELTNGNDVIRRVTDKKGAFLFDGLRPGKWSLKVYDYNLPAYHYLETASMDVELSAGENRDITIKVLPKRRSIIIIDSGDEVLTTSLPTK